MKKQTPPLKDRTIILGVTGSIAAYKAADITRRLAEAGANVFPVMTAEACWFIQPLTLQVLSRNPAATDLWDEENGWQPGHIELADRADFVAGSSGYRALYCFVCAGVGAGLTFIDPPGNRCADTVSRRQ